jgi:hypothetical protein
MARLGGSGGKFNKKTPWKGVPAGTYHVEIVEAKIAQRNKYQSTEKEDVAKIRYAVIEGERDRVYPPSFNQDHDAEDYNPYGKLVFQDVSLFLNPGVDGQKQSALYGLISAALYKGKEVPQDVLDYYTDGKISDEEAEARLNELLAKLTGQQLSITVTFKAGVGEKGDNNKVTSVAPVRKKLAAYERVEYALTPEQQADADPKIVDEKGNVFYGFYGSDGEFVPQATWAEKCRKKYGAVLSQDGIRAWKEAEAGKSAAAGTPGREVLPF